MTASIEARQHLESGDVIVKVKVTDDEESVEMTVRLGRADAREFAAGMLKLCEDNQ